MNYGELDIKSHINVDEVMLHVKETSSMKGGALDGGAKGTNAGKSRSGSRTKASKPVITSMNTFVNDMFIHIRYNQITPEPKHVSKITLTLNKFIYNFLMHLNFIISAKTDINYHPIVSKDLSFKVPIYVYTNDESKMRPLDLVLKRFEAVRSFIESYDFNSDTKATLWLIRTLMSLGINFNTDFYITCNCDQYNYKSIDEPLVFNIPDILYPNLKRHKLSDDSLITVYEDPYFNDYGVYINLSVPFNEMGMSYNALHIYEHLMTKGWKNLSVNDQILTNGVTYPNGICLVFNIFSSEKAFIECVNATFMFLFKIREENFWQEQLNEDILMETHRTISETRTERTLASMGRSDFHAYDNNYNKEIFEYWSNKPFTVLLTCPAGTKTFDPSSLTKLLRRYPLREVKRPANVNIKYYPLEVMNAKQINKLYILKAETDDIKEALLKPKLKTKVYFGIDCYIGQDENFEGNDLSYMNCVLHPLLYLNRYFTEEELIKCVRTHITAANSASMSNQSLCIRHAADILDELNLNV